MFALVYFVPALSALMWFVTFLLKADRQRRRTYTIALLGEFFFYILYAVFVLPDTDYMLMVKLDAVLVPLSLLAGAFLTIYIHILRTGKRAGGMYPLLFVPAIIMGSTIGILYYLIGFDDASAFTESFLSRHMWPAGYEDDIYRLYHLFDFSLKHIAAFVMIMAVIAESLVCVVGQKSGHKRSIALISIVEMLLLFPAALKGRTFLVDHSYINGTIAFLIGVAVHFRSQLEFHNDGDLSSVFVWPKVFFRSGQVHKQEHERARLSDLLSERLVKMMDEEHIFTDNSLTVNSLADSFGVSRSTMSSIVSSVFGMPFREYVNDRRIEYAKEYMLANPKATQEAIAAECGFKDGNLFNRKFKRVVGETPLEWLVKNYKPEP